MSGEMINFKNLALNVKDVDNLLTMPTFSSIQQRNRVLRDERAQAQAQADLNNPWLAEQRSFGESSQMEGYRPLYNMDGYTPSVEPVSAPEVPQEPTIDNLGGMGGDKREPTNLVTANTSPDNGASPTDPNTEAVKTKFEDEVSKVFSIQGLLQKLKELGSLQPGDNRDGLFQLDSAYKASNPAYGLFGTPGEYPMANGRAMWNFNMGNPPPMETEE